MPVKAFITDDAPSFYNAWTEVMRAPQHRLLCAWHVDKNWQESLIKYIQDKTLKAFTYKALRTVLAAPDELLLQEAIEHFIDWCEREGREYPGLLIFK